MNEPQTPERRVAVRWNSFQQTPCHFATLERIAARWATVLNVSRHGIGLLLPIQLNPGTEVIVELPCKDLANHKAVVAHVVHANSHDVGGWSLGCIFTRPLTQEELDTLT